MTKIHLEFQQRAGDDERTFTDEDPAGGRPSLPRAGVQASAASVTATATGDGRTAHRRPGVIPNSIGEHASSIRYRRSASPWIYRGAATSLGTTTPPVVVAVVGMTASVERDSQCAP